MLAAVLDCLERRRNTYEPDHCTLYIRTPNDRENVVYLRSDRPLSELDRNLIELFCGKISVGFDNLFLYEQLHKAQQGTLALLADLAERGNGNAERTETTLRIAAVAERVARRLHADGHYRALLDDPFLETVGLACIMHDVGNATVDPAILGKPGPLDVAERDAMRTHTVAGSRLLERATPLAESRTYLHLGMEIARHHHENWDGSGYPDSLKGEAIPLGARIAAVADSYDAMTSPRPHRPALGHAAAVAEIARGSGTRFDPTVAQAFLAVADEVAGI